MRGVLPRPALGVHPVALAGAKVTAARAAYYPAGNGESRACRRSGIGRMGRDAGRRRRAPERARPGPGRRASLAAAIAVAALGLALLGAGAAASAAVRTGEWEEGLAGADLPPLVDMERTSPEAPAVTAAKALLAEGRWQQALDVLTPVIRAGSTASQEDRTHGLMLAALAFAGSGEVDRALALLGEAAARNPGSVVIRLNQARVYADAGMLPEAEAALRQVDAMAAARRDPRLSAWSGALHHRVGLLALSSGRAEAAAEHFRQAVQADPGSALYQASLAGTLRALGRLPEAAGAYARAVERLGPAAPVGLLVEAGLTHLSIGELEKARGFFQQALQRSPAEPEALYGLGVAEAGLGRAEEARRHLEQVVQRIPWHWRAHFALGAALAATGDLAGAQRAYEEAVRLAPAVAELRAALGRLYLEVGRYREAEGQLQAALALGDGRPEVLYAIGRSQLLDGRAAEAAASFGRAAALEADAARKALYLYAQALAAEAGGDVAGAVRLLQQAVALDGGLFDAQLRLGELLLARGEAASAIGPLEMAAALRPGDPRALRALEAARRQAGRR